MADLDLTEAVRAALTAQLETARAATPGPWGPRDENGEFELSYGDFGWSIIGPAGGCETEDSEQGKADAAHIAANAPDVTITRVEALLRILDEYEQAREYYDANRSVPAGELHGLGTAIKILAEGLGIEVDG
jgi:hypothetical protein